MTNAGLRIVHFSTDECRPDVANGVARTVFHLSAAQQRLGHTVTVFADSVVPDATRQAEVELAGLRWSRLAQVAGRIPPALLTALRRTRPHIVHLHSIHVPENVALAGFLRRVGIPYCITVNGGLAPMARRRRRFRKWAFGILREQRYLASAAFVHAVTPDEEAQLRAYGVGVPIVVAPNAVQLDSLPRARDTGALRSAVPDLAGRRLFLFVGRLDPNQKGLDLLIEAFARLGDCGSGLVLVGPDWKNGNARLRALVRRRGLGDRVAFLGPAFGQAQADLVSGADVFVHTSRWEGLSLSVLEAAAWGKPCLLTPAADPFHALGAGGGAVVVDARPDAIAAGIRTMAAMDDAHLRQMGGRAQAIVARTFTWSRTAERLIQAYYSCADVPHQTGSGPANIPKESL